MKRRRNENRVKLKPGNIYDAFVKEYFGRVIVFSDFLLNYADEQFLQDVDVEKIEPGPTHYFGEKGDERISDMIFSCPLKNGDGTKKVIIVFEHQSGSLKRLPIKLHGYASAIWTAEMKEGKKVLSALYFIVLRTNKIPIRKIIRLADWLPKGSDNKPIGAAPEIEYKLVDLPAFDIKTLKGGPVLRVGLGILKKMTEGTEEEFPEALLPLLEVNDAELKLDTLTQILEFAAKVFAAHNKRLDKEMVRKAVNVIFKERTENMIATIFDEKFLEGKAEGIAVAEEERKPKWVAEGEARGEARGETKGLTHAIQSVLQARFMTVPKTLQKRLASISDLGQLELLTKQAATCSSLKEFEKLLR